MFLFHSILSQQHLYNLNTPSAMFPFPSQSRQPDYPFPIYKPITQQVPLIFTGNQLSNRTFEQVYNAAQQQQYPNQQVQQIQQPTLRPQQQQWNQVQNQIQQPTLRPQQQQQNQMIVQVKDKTKMKNKTGGHLYLIFKSNGYFKIGQTSSIDSRKRNYRTHDPSFNDFDKVWDVANPKDSEKTVHTYLRNNHFVPVHNGGSKEWWQTTFSKEYVINVVSKLI